MNRNRCSHSSGIGVHLHRNTHMPEASLNPGVSITTRSGHTAAWGISPLMNIGNNWSRLRSPDMINFPKRLVDQKRGQGQGQGHNLSRLPTRRCLSIFLRHTTISDEPNAGWIYVLSTRELPDLLKVGMTTHTVEQRAQEITRATGVALPFGVRRCWRVSEPAKAEKQVYQALHEFRLRDDREFFRVSFHVAVKRINVVIHESSLEIRTLDALAGLTPTS